MATLNMKIFSNYHKYARNTTQYSNFVEVLKKTELKLHCARLVCDTNYVLAQFNFNSDFLKFLNKI